MGKIDDGGAAFPYFDNSCGPWGGMTLRTWLAAHASEDDVIHHLRIDRFGDEPDREAARYRYADAMIAAGKADADQNTPNKKG